MRAEMLPLVLWLALFGCCAAVFLHVPSGFQGLIPPELEELNQNFTSKQESFLEDAILLLGEGKGDAVQYLKRRDPTLAKIAAPAFRSVEKKLENLNPRSIKFIGQLMEFLSSIPDDRRPDKNGNPKVPKEVHEISLASTWLNELNNETRTEIERVFPQIAKTLESKEFDTHARNEMSRNGWVIN
ncbi:hypothetical protein M3Y98_01217300 [Aphelenchoides besseyi]|nr:hypothetical protein M3Y98_01217300 [Aphelenchoides besseyi]KAI6193301.1 hypothetical protein M3Y96_01003700 [Aphelenchoides besseyi]